MYNDGGGEGGSSRDFLHFSSRKSSHFFGCACFFAVCVGRKRRGDMCGYIYIYMLDIYFELRSECLGWEKLGEKLVAVM